MKLPLENVKIINLTHYLQGPSCVQLLADLGADVIKVERIGGAFERHWSGAESYTHGGASVFYLLAGRNQRSIELDLKSARGRDILWQLIEGADVLVENFRPGTMQKLGFSFEAVHGRNPNLIFASLSGYGPKGPMAAVPGQDLLIQARSGMMRQSGRKDAPPTPAGFPAVDQHGAALAAVGILAALMGRASGGTGCKVDSNLLSAAMHIQSEPFHYFLNNPAGLYERSQSGIASRYHQAPYGAYQTSDGWLALSHVAMPELASVFQDDAFLGWSEQDTFGKREEINQAVARHLLERPTQDWIDIFEKRGIWFAEIADYADVADSEQFAQMGGITTSQYEGEEVKLLAHPILYDGEAPGVRLPPPRLGEHTREILRELGYADDAIEEMVASRAVGPDRRAPREM